MSSLGDRRHRDARIAPASLLQGMTSSRREALMFCWSAHLCDVIPQAPMTGGVARQRRCPRVRCLTAVALGWHLVKLAASALWLCGGHNNCVSQAKCSVLSLKKTTPPKTKCNVITIRNICGDKQLMKLCSARLNHWLLKEQRTVKDTASRVNN